MRNSKHIYNSSPNICAEMLNKELPYDLNPIDSPTFGIILRTPISIDDMFVSLYDNVGIDIRDIWKKADNSTLDEGIPQYRHLFFIWVY